METSFFTQIVGYRVAMVGNEILYSRKYWPCLNLAVWSQTNPKKKKIIFGGGISGPFIKECCRLSPEQNHEFANLQEIKLAVC